MESIEGYEGEEEYERDLILNNNTIKEKTSICTLQNKKEVAN